MRSDSYAVCSEHQFDATDEKSSDRDCVEVLDTNSTRCGYFETQTVVCCLCSSPDSSNLSDFPIHGDADWLQAFQVASKNQDFLYKVGVLERLKLKGHSSED